MKTRYTSRLFGAACAAALLAASGSAPVLSQDNAGATAQSGSEQSTSASSGQASSTSGDPLLVTVNGTEIRQSDLLSAISSLPPQMQQLPEEMLVGLAVDQLVARQLILEEARAQNLAEDPEVQSLVEPMVSSLTDQAVVQVWLQRELESQITEENLQQAFAGYQAANPGTEASFEEVRPQLVQALRQEAMSGLTEELRQNADVVFYDASGNPAQDPGTSGSDGASQSSGDSGTESSGEQTSSNGESTSNEETSQ